MEQHSKCYCSVPFCSNSKRKHPNLSFHDFPKDTRLRGKWIIAIRREESATFTVLRGSTYVCSQHFRPEELYVKEGGSRARLKKGSVPSRFAWNDFGSRHEDRLTPYERASTRLGLNTEAAAGQRDELDDLEAMLTELNANATEHDYCRPPSPGKVDAAVARIRELEQKVVELENEIKQLTLLADQPKLNHFCSTDEEFRFFTRFPSEEVFMLFWESVAPSASRIVYWTKAQREAYGTPSPHRKLGLIDECFLFLCRIAAGLKEQALASMFKVSLSTVSRIIITWTSYFYLVLGSLPTWMTRQQVQATMPKKIRQYCPEVRVLIDCTEVRCETATSLTLQSESFSNYKNHTTFKSLVGVAPCGVITFVSKLYTGSISDQELTRRSNFIRLLQPGDKVMADKGFQIEGMLAEVGATIIIPPFKRSVQFTKEDAEKTQAIACLRVLVERAIRRVKEYHIWDGVVPLSLTGSVNQLWAVCCLMSNYQGPLDIMDDKPV
ncbi:uncharacterized protein LOC111196133 [Astyanax mexicanus]|uniref:uncharacterized protein LOC111196133 n=1 Tax=Astyanax mexicanus TaxID=7994 RepID=UPI0020CAF1A5|nr:uncharacterized protein LOC111196133 [Astyanax mexicanus]